jgi:hypothetical protein
MINEQGVGISYFFKGETEVVVDYNGIPELVSESDSPAMSYTYNYEWLMHEIYETELREGIFKTKFMGCFAPNGPMMAKVHTATRQRVLRSKIASVDIKCSIGNQ